MARILVVDDDARSLRLAVTVIAQCEHEVLAAAGRAKRVEAARAQLRDLVLMDAQMPGVDRAAALAQLRTDLRTAQIRIVTLTAPAMKGDAEKLIARGFDGCLGKPIRDHEFVARASAQRAERKA